MVISITECALIGSRAAPEPVVTSLRCDLVKSRNLLMQDGGVDAMVLNYDAGAGSLSFSLKAAS